MFARRLFPRRGRLPPTSRRLPKGNTSPATGTRYQSTQISKQATRIDRITARLPRRLQPYTRGLRDAPVSHIVSFLILHELTAVVPLLALFGLFHYGADHVPLGRIAADCNDTYLGDYVRGGVARFESYFSRKGWFGFGRDDDGATPFLAEGRQQLQDKGGSREQTDKAVQRFRSGEEKYRILVEVALAYAVTKALLPIRIIASVSATPWFAGVLGRARKAVSSRKS
ncbi:hypothetical protein GMORB2_2771 [Geosmithia morbida]|uniref:Uncharacterized protein n=1 Tax=Geosmithia morbida TaxID=1094350 RepID=A0A9P5CZQ3_9HYPO|nr:uncharacterized protein GMORB2_2771 [Geosmithia morbida]KAF4120767.1 hypothetical protein GMORB2_2771 [Geosmithia morbida]